MAKRRLFFVHEGKAAYPEIAAYSDFFRDSFDVSVIAPAALSAIEARDSDVFWYLMGVYPTRPLHGFVVHDYRSLSVGGGGVGLGAVSQALHLSAVKDWIKKKVNAKPDARVFLSAVVREKMGFADDVPWRIVPMGVPVFVRDFAASRRRESQDPVVGEFLVGPSSSSSSSFSSSFSSVSSSLLLSSPSSCDPDFCYIGAMSRERRTSVMIDSFLRRFGATRRLTLFGVPQDGLDKLYAGCSSVVFAGRLPQADLFSVLCRASCAVNYFPVHPPHLFQPPTKFLEYAALGLRILCNEHPQSRALAAQYGVNAFWGSADDMFASVPEDMSWPDNRGLDPSPFLWPDVLQASGVADLLRAT